MKAKVLVRQETRIVSVTRNTYCYCFCGKGYSDGYISGSIAYFIDKFLLSYGVANCKGSINPLTLIMGNMGLFATVTSALFLEVEGFPLCFAVAHGMPHIDLILFKYSLF